MKIIKQNLDKITEFKKPMRKFLLEMILTILSNPGKINFRNLSRYCNYHEKSISRNFKSEQVNFFKLNHALTETIKPVECIIALDCSFIEKSGKKTDGKGNFYNSKTGKAESGLEISTLSLIDVEDNTAYALETRQTPANLTNKSRVDFYAKQITDNKENLAEFNHIVVDGYYSKVKFVNAVMSSNLDMVGKLRKDANLMYLYEGDRTGKKGSPRKYSGKVALSNHDFEYVKDLDKGYKLYTKIVWSVRFKSKIRIALVSNGKTQTLYFSTDLNLSAEKIYQYYQSRYQIEFLFRDGKSHLGLEDCMSTDKKALDFHFNICLTTLNVAKVDDRLKRTERKPFSIINYKRRLLNEKLVKLFLFKFDLDHEFVKNQKEYLEVLNYGTISS